MKNVKVLLVMAAMAFAVASCAKLEKVLPKNGGTWKVTSQTVVTYESGAQVASEVTPADSLPTYVFNDDASGRVEYPNESPDLFNWTTNADNDQIILTDQQSNISLAIDVLESKGNTQKWYLILGEEGVDYFEFNMDVERE